MSPTANGTRELVCEKDWRESAPGEAGDGRQLQATLKEQASSKTGHTTVALV